jgi:trimeric autotransporter adhesin
MKKIIILTLLIFAILQTGTAQTLTGTTIEHPTAGTTITVTSPLDITATGGTISLPADGAFKIGGFNALSSKGFGNTFVGQQTGNAITTGVKNTFNGHISGLSTTTGSANTFMGYLAGLSNTTGGSNTFIGTDAGTTNSIGDANLFLGTASGYYNSNGNRNNFIGFSSGFSNTSGNYNLFIGGISGFNNTTGGLNIFLGESAGKNNTIGNRNVFIGTNSGSNTLPTTPSEGTRNTFVGDDSGLNNITGFNNTYIGANAGSLDGTLSNATAIGFSANATQSNTIVLGQNATTITGQGLASGLSGLRFANLNASSATTTATGNKVLTVDGSGNVILASLMPSLLNSNLNTNEINFKNENGYLYNNSTNGLVINGNGYEGNPLIVKGGILAKELNIRIDGAENFPDYVFKPEYKLMPISELKAFIKQHSHLPNVPSASEVAEKGNNIGKNFNKLLEKVEELTLYIIELKEENDNIKQQLKSLQK